MSQQEKLENEQLSQKRLQPKYSQVSTSFGFASYDKYHQTNFNQQQSRRKAMVSQCSKPWYPCHERWQITSKPCHDLGKDSVTMQDRANANQE